MSILFNADIFQSHLRTTTLGRSMYEYHRWIDSTNIRTKSLGKHDAPEGTLVIAETQTAGRGRLGRSWHSPPGLNLYFSLIIRPELPLERFPLLTLAAGLGAAEAITALTGLPSSVKWPNDVLLDGRKTCGILTEMENLLTGVPFAVLGIGINVNIQAGDIPDDLKDKAGSLAMATGREWPREQLLAEVLNRLEIGCRDLNQGRHKEVLTDYRRVCATIGSRVVVSGEKQRLAGKAVDVDDEGRLVVQQDSDGRTFRVNAGEVTLSGGVPY